MRLIESGKVCLLTCKYYDRSDYRTKTLSGIGREMGRKKKLIKKIPLTTLNGDLQLFPAQR
jgi:hypothetical protein